VTAAYIFKGFRSGLRVFMIAWIGLVFASNASAQVTSFRQAVAEGVAQDDRLAAFYRSRNFEGIWTGSDASVQTRRNALLAAFDTAAMHGLPAAKYDAELLISEMRAAKTPFRQGEVEVELTRQFLDFVQDIRHGILKPNAVVPMIKREVDAEDPVETLERLLAGDADAFFRDLSPRSLEYARLLREKIRLERQISNGGWGPRVNADKLTLGSQGAEVVQLRNRLIAMGYLERSASQEFDVPMELAVRAFQQAHGLEVDGEAGTGTISEINVSMERRLRSIVVAMERERWLNRPGQERHIWVNLTDFSARIVENERVVFQTRSVIGANDDDRQSPEFSDMMEFMVINPSWYVPRSIITKEYLPQLQRNPNAVRHLEITDRRGRVVNRGSVDFTQYNRRNFPFAMRQPPSRSNALGLVKFMFPNQYNIYLHDTPAKNLFSRETRAYSHGCIRLNDPFDFAYELLSVQESDPVGFFQARLQTDRETRVDLERPLPVHLVYRTAVTDALGNLVFRRDIYGRDAQIWEALAREGVAISSVQG